VAPFRWLAGECGARLAAPEFFTELPAPAYPCAVLAGTRGIYGRLSPFGGEPNDGIVALSETRLGTEHPVLRFPVTHTFMMNDRQVQRTVVELLQRADPPGGEP
jgi:hypothetical protein